MSHLTFCSIRPVPTTPARAAERTRWASLETHMQRITSSRSFQALAALSGALYVLCLFSPAYVLQFSAEKADPMPGYLALVLGPVMVTGGVLAWLANPMWLAGWILCAKGKPWASVTCGIAAISFAMSFLLVDTLPAGTSDMRLPFAVSAGYYLWTASIGTLLLSAALSLNTSGGRTW